MHPERTHGGHGPLYRSAALAALAREDGGVLCIAAPPSTLVALLLAGVVLALLAAALVVVQVPQRAAATGVLMPVGGLTVLAAPDAGSVETLAVREGEQVSAGTLLLTVAGSRRDMSGQRVAGLRLASLRRERDLAQRAEQERMLRYVNGREALQERIAMLQQQQELAAQDVTAGRDAVAVATRHLQRVETLAGRGAVATASIEEQESLLRDARRQQRETERRRLELAAEYRQQTAAAAAVDADNELAVLHYAIEVERLARELQATTAADTQRIEAPFAAEVARISVRTGASVMTGQPLLTLVRPGQPLEAWLYVASRDIGRVQPGQVVLLRLDAWPQEVFGTPRAVVTSVSPGAVSPRELSVPLALPGPVFEIRARLDRQTVAGLSRRWSLRPGTSFRADIVKARYPLYEWLSRSLKDAFDAPTV